MSKANKNESGFGVIETLLTFTVAIFLGVVGWGVYRSHNKTPSSNTSSIASSASKTTTQSTPETNTNVGYLVIKEWGIKIKLEDASKVVYVMNGTPNGPTNADSLTSFAALRLKDSVTALEVCRSLGVSISQTTAATNATKIGKYYYGFEGGSDPCGDSSIDPLRAKITGTELVLGAIVPE